MARALCENPLEQIALMLGDMLGEQFVEAGKHGAKINNDERRVTSDEFVGSVSPPLATRHSSFVTVNPSELPDFRAFSMLKSRLYQQSVCFFNKISEFPAPALAFRRNFILHSLH